MRSIMTRIVYFVLTLVALVWAGTPTLRQHRAAFGLCRCLGIPEAHRVVHAMGQSTMICGLTTQDLNEMPELAESMARKGMTADQIIRQITRFAWTRRVLRMEDHDA